MTDIVRGERDGAPRRRARRGPVDRVCAHPSCGTRLSIYNDGKHCSLHAPMVVPRTRGRKLAS